MGTPAILYTNLADAGTVTVSSAVASAPASMLQDQHVTRRWKGNNGTTEYVLCDLGSSQSIDTIALLGCQKVAGADQINLTSAALTQIRVSTVDATGVAGNALNLASTAGRIDSAYGALVIAQAAPVTGRYVRIDVSEAGATAILAGRLVIGLRSAFTNSAELGWSQGYTDLSRTKESAGGQQFVDRDERYRMLTINFPVLASADRYGFVDSADRLNGISQDVLFMIDPTSSTMARDSVWGLMRDLSPPTQPNFGLFAKSYSVRERR